MTSSRIVATYRHPSSTSVELIHPVMLTEPGSVTLVFNGVGKESLNKYYASGKTQIEEFLI